MTYDPAVDGEQVTRADIEFHAATAHLYEETLDPLFRAHDAVVVGPLLDSLRSMTAGDEALDIGCGTGLLAARLATRGFRVTGIDHSEAMLELARARLLGGALDARVTLQTGDVRALPFDDETFDLVTCTGVLHHLPAIDRALVEAHRVLRPKGVLCIAEPCRGTNPPLRLWEALTGLYRRLRPPEPTPVAAEIPDHQEGPIDSHELDAILARLGMSRRTEFWSFFRGLHRLPLALQKAVIVAGSRPWRGGNMVVVRARR